MLETKIKKTVFPQYYLVRLGIGDKRLVPLSPMLANEQQSLIPNHPISARQFHTHFFLTG